MTERWRTIPSHAAYEVSDLGRVRRGIPGRCTYVGKILQLYPNVDGYPMAGLYDPTRRRSRGVRVHQLVAETFLGPRPDGKVINHKNGQKDDNRPENLEYVTGRENEEHAARHGLKKGARGERSGSARLTESEVMEIRCLRKSGMYYKQIAVRFGVRLETVRRICLGRTWSHLPCDTQDTRALPVPRKGAANGYARLTEQDVLEIRRCAENGERQSHLARRFAVGRAQISKIVLRQSWSHI